jgi:hypothetical protein
LRSWIRGASSILAIAGGALFLVLPIPFLKGTVSITYPLVHFCHVPPEEVNSCPLIPLAPPPTGMAAFWAYLGAIGIILGALALKLSLRPRVGVALGFVLSLGSMTLLFWTLTRQILKSFITKPASFLVFPELSVVAMAGATVLFGYELSRRRRDISEAFLSYSFLWRFRLDINPVRSFSLEHGSSARTSSSNRSDAGLRRPLLHYDTIGSVTFHSAFSPSSGLS